MRTLFSRLPKVTFRTARQDIIPSVNMFGIELEFFLVDKEGRISNSADEFISSVKKQLLDTNLVQECGRSMIELSTFPHISAKEVFGEFFTDMETILAEAEKRELGLFYYGTYPGKNKNIMRQDPRYKATEKILGKKEFETAGKCVGFHFHFSLPKNSLSKAMNFFYLDVPEPRQSRILNLFNLNIALDPAITTLMQSSPYFDGRLYGKDSRVMFYRGDPDFDVPNKLYSRYPDFGRLNDYNQNFSSILEDINRRTHAWNALLKKAGYSYSDFAKKKPSMMDSSWKPVKISSHGTIENRGADMNSLSKIVSISLVLKAISKFIQSRNPTILPSEVGNVDPFLLEDNVIYIPTQDKLSILKRNAAIAGLEDDQLRKYCMGFLRLAQGLMPKTPRSLTILKDILSSGTLSDQIISHVKKVQGSSSYGQIDSSTAESIAMQSSEKIFKDMILTKKIFDKHTESSLYW